MNNLIEASTKVLNEASVEYQYDHSTSIEFHSAARHIGIHFYPESGLNNKSKKFGIRLSVGQVSYEKPSDKDGKDVFAGVKDKSIDDDKLAADQHKEMKADNKAIAKDLKRLMDKFDKDVVSMLSKYGYKKA